MIDIVRLRRFHDLYRLNQSAGLKLLYEWVRTGVINRTTFIACTCYIVPDGSGT